MTLGEFIQKYRLEHDLSQRQFAQKCGVSNGYISLLERGFNRKTGKPVTPTFQQVQKIADGMGVIVDDIFASVDDFPMRLGRPDLQAEAEHAGALVPEIATIILRLSPEKQKRALHYLRFLEASEED